jgi:pimeloyl-ACP methyl ester carboxylesterase
MKKTLFFFTLINLSITFDACSPSQTMNTTTHSITFLNGSNGNKLEVLDWSGTGKPILFLSGIGNTAHVFDNFAPKFTDQFHVYGLTRRGYGASAQPVTGYNTTTLAEDILPILDSLHIAKVILIGHSISGSEISKFASTHPDRVEKIIYMDAAYDFSFRDGDKIAKFQVLRPKITDTDLSSIGHLNQYCEKLCGGPLPIDDMKEIAFFSKDGRYLKDVTPDSITTAIFKNVEHPDYMHIKCPALAIYASYTSIEGFFSDYNGLDAAGKKIGDDFFAWYAPYIDTEMKRFKSETPNGTVKTITNANHFIFISNSVETEKMIRDFL